MDREILEAVLGSFSRILKDVSSIRESMEILEKRMERSDRTFRTFSYQIIKVLRRFEKANLHDLVKSTGFENEPEYRVDGNTKALTQSSTRKYPKFTEKQESNNEYQDLDIWDHLPEDKRTDRNCKSNKNRPIQTNSCDTVKSIRNTPEKNKKIENFTDKPEVIKSSLGFNKGDHTKCEFDKRPEKLINENSFIDNLSQSRKVSKSQIIQSEYEKNSKIPSRYNQFDPNIGLKEISQKTFKKLSRLYTLYIQPVTLSQARVAFSQMFKKQIRIMNFLV